MESEGDNPLRVLLSIICFALLSGGLLAEPKRPLKEPTKDIASEREPAKNLNPRDRVLNPEIKDNEIESDNDDLPFVPAPVPE